LILCNNFSFLISIIENVNVIICVHEISKIWWFKNGQVVHKCIYHLIDHFVEVFTNSMPLYLEEGCFNSLHYD
jgi:hypothetical protein